MGYQGIITKTITKTPEFFVVVAMFLSILSEMGDLQDPIDGGT
jgi:hypothetical protein